MSVSFDDDRPPRRAAAGPSQDTGAVARRPVVVPKLATLAAQAHAQPQTQPQIEPRAEPQAEPEAPAPAPVADELAAPAPQVPRYPVVELPAPDPADLEDSVELPAGADPEYGPQPMVGPQPMIGPQPEPVTVRQGRNGPRSTGVHAFAGAGIGAGLGSVAGGVAGGALGAVFGGGPLGMLFGGLVGVGAGALLGAGVGALAGAAVGAFRNRTSARLAAASAPETSPEDLSPLLADEDPAVRKAALANPNVSPDDLDKILRDASVGPLNDKTRDVVITAIRHRNTSAEALDSLARSTDDHLLLGAIAEQQVTTPDTLLEMTKREAGSSVPFVMFRLACRQEMPPEGLGNMLDACEHYAIERGSWRAVLKLIKDHPRAGAQAERASDIIAKMDGEDPDRTRRDNVEQEFGVRPPPDRRSAFARAVDSSPLHANRDTDAATAEAQSLGFTNVDLSDFSPESANEVVATLSELKRRYPTVSGMEFLGSISTHERATEELGGKPSASKKNTSAYTSSAGVDRKGTRGFAIGDDMASSDTAEANIHLGSYQSGHNSTQNMAGVIAHEFGHAVQNHLELTKSFRQIKEQLARMRVKGDTPVAREVSMYGASHSGHGDPNKELFAELFSDYIMSSSPSENAQVIGHMTDDALKAESTDPEFQNPLEARDQRELAARNSDWD